MTFPHRGLGIGSVGKNVDRNDDDADQPQLEARFMEIGEKEDESSHKVLSLVHGELNICTFLLRFRVFRFWLGFWTVHHLQKLTFFYFIRAILLSV